VLSQVTVSSERHITKTASKHFFKVHHFSKAKEENRLDRAQTSSCLLIKIVALMNPKHLQKRIKELAN
jgi:hypothetical protein